MVTWLPKAERWLTPSSVPLVVLPPSRPEGLAAAFCLLVMPEDCAEGRGPAATLNAMCMSLLALPGLRVVQMGRPARFGPGPPDTFRKPGRAV
jgi:hypothetical protein